MTAFDILADEHVEKKGGRYLAKMGHAVEFVVDLPNLGPGTDDRRIAGYADQVGKLVLTHDDDFVSDIGSDQHAGVLFVVDDNYSAYEVATMVNEISSHMTQRHVDVVYVSKNWL